MTNIQKRLSDLERTTAPASGRIPYLVLWSDPDEPGVYYERPGPDRGRRFEAAERQALSERVETLILVDYGDWPAARMIGTDSW